MRHGYICRTPQSTGMSMLKSRSRCGPLTATDLAAGGSAEAVEGSVESFR